MDAYQFLLTAYGDTQRVKLEWHARLKDSKGFGDQEFGGKTMEAFDRASAEADGAAQQLAAALQAAVTAITDTLYTND